MNDDTIYIYDEEISTSTKKCLLFPKYFLVSFSKISFRAPSLILRTSSSVSPSPNPFRNSRNNPKPSCSSADDRFSGGNQLIPWEPSLQVRKIFGPLVIVGIVFRLHVISVLFSVAPFFPFQNGTKELNVYFSSLVPLRWERRNEDGGRILSVPFERKQRGGVLMRIFMDELLFSQPTLCFVPFR